MMEEDEGIYRNEVTLMLGMLAEIREKVDKILGYIEEEDDEEEADEDLPDS
jgi:hypothetical protein